MTKQEQLYAELYATTARLMFNISGQYTINQFIFQITRSKNIIRICDRIIILTLHSSQVEFQIIYERVKLFLITEQAGLDMQVLQFGLVHSSN